jgi:DNA-binding NarL/FixJ family response regulator
MKSWNILLVDDHAVFRTGLRMVLSESFPQSAIFEAGTLVEALESKQESVDVVLLDIKLNGLNGLEGIIPLKRKWQNAFVFMLSSQSDSSTVQQALARGAAGFFSKADSAEHIVSTIKLIFSGQIVKLPDVGRSVSPKGLTMRQLEVLTLLHGGLSNKQIAAKLSLSNNTVRRHVQDILQHFGVASRAEAVFASQRQNL